MSGRINRTDARKDAIGRVCVNCGSTDDLNYHHIVPLSMGGQDVISNMVCLCGKCHDLIHYDSRGKISHSKAAREGIKAAKARGVHFGKKPINYERVMMLIAKHSTQFNDIHDSGYELFTEKEIMDMAGIKSVCYCKCKRMLIGHMNASEWPFDWDKPRFQSKRPLYEQVIRRLRGETT